MHNLRCQPASPDLREFVRTYAQREMFDLPKPILMPVPARLEQTLEFQFAESFEVVTGGGRREFARPITVVGSYTEEAVAVFKNKIISFGIFFQPVGLSRLFRIPPSEFSNRAFDARDVLSDGIQQLYDQLAECKSFAIRVAVVEHFLRGLASRRSVRDNDLGCSAAGYIFQANGAVRMIDLAACYGISVRQLERRIRCVVGIAPKTYACVARFQTALDAKLLTPNRSWMSIAHDLGYHDQMHMVHDFHKLAGGAPAEILAHIGDARPPAMQNFSQF
jgi:AraC-like DNA-binding protein